jgi:hypothetical protein
MILLQHAQLIERAWCLCRARQKRRGADGLLQLLLVVLLLLVVVVLELVVGRRWALGMRIGSGAWVR